DPLCPRRPGGPRFAAGRQPALVYAHTRLAFPHRLAGCWLAGGRFPAAGRSDRLAPAARARRARPARLADRRAAGCGAASAGPGAQRYSGSLFPDHPGLWRALSARLAAALRADQQRPLIGQRLTSRAAKAVRFAGVFPTAYCGDGTVLSTIEFIHVEERPMNNQHSPASPAYSPSLQRAYQLLAPLPALWLALLGLFTLAV